MEVSSVPSTAVLAAELSENGAAATSDAAATQCHHKPKRDPQTQAQNQSKKGFSVLGQRLWSAVR